MNYLSLELKFQNCWNLDFRERISSDRKNKQGLAQRGVVSPFMVHVHMNSMHRRTFNLQFVTYADNITFKTGLLK